MVRETAFWVRRNPIVLWYACGTGVGLFLFNRFLLPSKRKGERGWPWLLVWGRGRCRASAQASPRLEARSSSARTTRPRLSLSGSTETPTAPGTTPEFASACASTSAPHLRLVHHRCRHQRKGAVLVHGPRLDHRDLRPLRAPDARLRGRGCSAAR
jgi:hypothetical protein